MHNNYNLYFAFKQSFVGALLFLSPILSFSQNIGIHAESVGEWHSKEKFSPEYHYNSVAVYLLNEDKILELFNPDNLTREQRKLTGVRNFDIVESVYFSLQLPNPKKEDDIIDFPLYAFDINNSKSFQVPRNQGKILDRITDEELNGRGMEATAKIEAIKKNQLLEVAYQISSSINKILGDKIFHNPGISGVMRKAQSFFEDKYRGKIVSEFTIPILPGNEDFEYRLHSASLYQVKWDFQNKVKTYKNNIWSDIKDDKVVTEEQLKNRPSRLSRYNNHPYLLVMRYKSAYSLPEAHKLNVRINQKYLDERLYNLQEFRKNGNQYRTEEAFLTLLRDAIDMQRNCENYRRSKEKGEEEHELMLQIAQQHYEILNAYKKEVAHNAKAPETQEYFTENYGVSYYKFFKLIDNILFLDQQLKDIGKVPSILKELDQIELDNLQPNDIYNYLKRLETYRRVASNVPQIEGDLFYKIREYITQLESRLYPMVFNVPPIGDKRERVDKFKALKEQYQLCTLCQTKADGQITAIQQSIDDEIRAELFAIQNKQLKLRKCFSDIQLNALLQLTTRYPQPDSLSQLEQLLYQSYLDKIKGLEPIAQEFQQLEKVNIEKLNSQKLPVILSNYQGILANFRNEACQLYYGEILKKELLDCLEGGCKVAIP